MRAFVDGQTDWAEGGRAGFYSLYGRAHRAERSAAQCVDRGASGYRRPVVGLVGRGGVRGDLPRHWQPDVSRAGVHRVLFEPVQSRAGRLSGRRAYRDGVIAMVMARGLCNFGGTDRESSEFSAHTDPDRLAAATFLPVQKKERGGAALL